MPSGTTIIFVDRTIFIQRPRSAGRRSAASCRSQATLFVTDSIPELSGEALAFLSSIRPNSMSILAIDKDLRCRLIYNPFCKNDLLRGQETRLDAIGEVEWVGNGRFVLKERAIPSMNRAAFSPRLFE